MTHLPHTPEQVLGYLRLCLDEYDTAIPPESNRGEQLPLRLWMAMPHLAVALATLSGRVQFSRDLSIEDMMQSVAQCLRAAAHKLDERCSP